MLPSKGHCKIVVMPSREWSRCLQWCPPSFNNAGSKQILSSFCLQSIRCMMMKSLGKTASGLLGQLEEQCFRRILCILRKLWVCSALFDLHCICSATHVCPVSSLDAHMFLLLCKLATLSI